MRLRKNSDACNSSGKRIVFATFPTLDVASFGEADREIMEHLVMRGHDVSLLALRSKKMSSTEKWHFRIITIPLAESARTRILTTMTLAFFSFFLFLYMPFYIMFSKPDFIVFGPHSALGFISSLPFSLCRRVKLVVDIRSTPVENVGPRGIKQDNIFNASVLMAKALYDGIVIITPLMKKEICETFSIDPNKVGIYSSGVSLERFQPHKYDKDRVILRRRLCLTDKFVVLYHGSFRAHGGLVETIKALSLAKRKCPNVVFFLLGAGNIPNLCELTEKSHTKDNVIVHEPVKYADVPKYIAMCDVGIVPLPNISFWRHQCPLKLLEYLAMKKPVIVTDIPAHRLIVNGEKCGIYIPEVNPHEIAKAIVHAYANREKLEEWGETGRRIVANKYAWEKVAVSLENYLLSL